MYLSGVTDAATGGFAGLEMVLASDRVTGLALEHDGAWRTRLSRSGQPLLWGRAETDRSGIWLVRRELDGPLAIVSPITALEARKTTRTEDWMKWMARALDDSAASPLHRGNWQLTELCRRDDTPADVRWPRDPDGLPCVAYGLLTALTRPPIHFESWGINGSGEVHPLRAPSPPDAARVRSWRKHAREGTLPPILLWWVCAFDLYLILDGHDRLQAATLEGVDPRVIALWEPTERRIHGGPAPWQEAAVRDYARAFEREHELSPTTRVRLNESLVRASTPGWRSCATRARFRPGLTREWLAEVSVEIADRPDVAAALCGD